MKPTDADFTYFSTTAQVLPLMLFAIVLELRVFAGPRPPRAGSRVMAWYMIAGTVLAFLFLGEAVALSTPPIPAAESSSR
jgi:hypothetical protein